MYLELDNVYENVSFAFYFVLSRRNIYNMYFVVKATFATLRGGGGPEGERGNGIESWRNFQSRNFIVRLLRKYLKIHFWKERYRPYSRQNSFCCGLICCFQIENVKRKIDENIYSIHNNTTIIFKNK